MKLLYSLKDDQYPYKGIDHTREIVRAILLNQNNEILLEYIFDDDGFGHRDYYETPGGGVKNNESFEDALKREIAEEVGYKIAIISPIGDVIDYYNLIKRENHNHYFLARITGRCNKHPEEDEKKRIKKIVWVNIDEAIRLYESMQDELVGKLVKRRELPILKLVKSTLQEGLKPLK